MAMRTKFYTDKDLDGIISGIIAENSLYGNEIDTTYVRAANLDEQIQQDIEILREYDNIYIFDMAPKNIEILSEFFDKTVIIDHHKSALELNKYDFCNIQVGEEYNSEKLTCASSLVYRYFKNNNSVLKELAELTRKYDTFEWFENKEEAPRNLDRLLWIMGFSEFKKYILYKLNDEEFEFGELAETILRLEDTKYNEYLEEKINVMTIYNKKATVAVVYSDRFTSELCNDILIRNNDIDIVISINAPKKISLRTSRVNIDLSEICKHFGGGGHPKAGGFTFDLSTNQSEEDLVDLVLGQLN